MSNSKFEAVYAKTVYADSVIAPSFTGQNTVGCELRQDNYWMDASTYHTWGHNMAWTPAVNDGFYNPANPKRVTVDATGFYRISYSVQLRSTSTSILFASMRPTAPATTIRCTRKRPAAPPQLPATSTCRRASTSSCGVRPETAGPTATRRVSRWFAPARTVCLRRPVCGRRPMLCSSGPTRPAQPICVLRTATPAHA